MPICRFAAEPPQGAPAAGGDPAGRVPRRLPAGRDRGRRPGPRRRGRDPLVPRPHVVGPHLRARDRAHRHRPRALRLRLLRRRGDEPSELYAWADYTPDIAEDHPEWRMDICQEVVGGWRGERGEVAAMTLIWGVPFERRGAIVTAELGDDDRRRGRGRRRALHAARSRRLRRRVPRHRAAGRRRERAGARVALRGRRRVAVAVVAVDHDAVDQAVVRAPPRA